MSTAAELVLSDAQAIALMDEAERALAEINSPEDANELRGAVKHFYVMAEAG